MTKGERVPFVDIELRPALQEVFFLLLDGSTLQQIQDVMGIKEGNLRTLLSRLDTVLYSAMPAGLTKYHLAAREFMRQQEDILRGQQVTAPVPLTADEEIDSKIQFFFPSGKAKSATA